MAAFSGHREDGDELLGCCFSVAYSHVEERWWAKSGEDEFSLLSFWRRGELFFFFYSAVAVQGCPVILRLQCNCCVFETRRNKMFLHVLGWWWWHSSLIHTSPLSTSHPSNHWDSLSTRGKTLPMQGGKNAPPSASSHLLFTLCFLTFINNSFHWREELASER